MLQSLITQLKPLYCQQHKKQLITHICIDITCNNNSILCSQCISQGYISTYHLDHQKNIVSILEGIQKLCDIIKKQSGPIQKIYKSTLGRNDYLNIVAQLQKGSKFIQQLDHRISNIKNQMDSQIEILKKQVQKILILQKEQYYKLLDHYRKIFIKNYQYLQRCTQPLFHYQHQIKYYINNNNLYLKILAEGNKKSEWLQQTKIILNQIQKNIQNINYNNQISNILSMTFKSKLDNWPKWRGQQWQVKNNEYKFAMKRVINQWIYIPQIKNLQEQIQNGTINGNHQAVTVKNYYVQSNGK